MSLKFLSLTPKILGVPWVVHIHNNHMDNRPPYTVQYNSHVR